MKNIFLLILFVCALFYARASNSLQTHDSTGKGVQFDNSRWQQVLKKAKKANKYIFIDCYTTWCGPCKQMEKEVYVKPEVGDYVNRHFISVKIQIDKTPNDDEQTRAKRSDADLIRKEYGIPAYPTYFIFSPDSKLISRASGFKPADDFLGFVSGAIDPGAFHPYAKYYALLNDFKNGKRDYTVINLLLDTAKLLGQVEISDSLTKDYTAYLSTINDDALYTKESVDFLSTHIEGSKSKFFHLFHPNEERINTLMGKRGYAQLVVGRIIAKEDIDPVVQLAMGGHNADSSLSDENGPDWKQLTKSISARYSAAYAEENILKAKAKWFNEHHDQANQAKYFTLLIQKYGENMDANKGSECANFMDCDLNTWCWGIFKYSVDKEQINVSIDCMKGVIERYMMRGWVPVEFMDTYANLLYKAGRLKEAVEIEEEGISNLVKSKTPESDIRRFREALEKMKKGLPTWPHYIDKNDFFGMGLN